MTISGFTFIRNGFKLRYPFIESIQSILPICDEVVVAVGNSDDGTRESIANISSKIKIIDTIWDDSLREGGKILAQQTNIALDAITGDWGFYIQGDEVVHESELQNIVKSAERNLNESQVDGLLFDWYHFFGNYDYIVKPGVRGVYNSEVRLIRNHKLIRSFRDAQGFRKFRSAEALLKNEMPSKLKVRKANAHIYHYGKVRGPEAELERTKSFHKLWHDDDWVKKFADSKTEFDYTTSFPLIKFQGTHPSVMREKVLSTNWNFEPRKGETRVPFKYKLMNSLEALTGWRPFEFRNYVLI